jgi:acetoin utilization deacetylase AcuC-like enzyme
VTPVALHALESLRHWRIWDRQLPIWYDAEYRMPLTAFGKRTGLEPRRADLVAWYLLERGWITTRNLRSPIRARYEDIARVHTEAYLESLARHGTLARIFGVDPWDVPVDELMQTIRLGCGGTLAAARESLTRRGPAVNLMGGFHHAFPGHGAGLCALNDIAIAVRAVQHEGFTGRVAVIDLDAHPPDGTAACLRDDERVWIGSLSGASSGVIPGVDEQLLPESSGDAAYLAALDALLARMPAPDLAFVIAGGDVLAGDHLGHLELTLAGARRRDLRVAQALRGRPSVWLPGGGYHPKAWKVLAGTVLALARHTLRPISPGADPLTARFARLAQRLAEGPWKAAPPGDLTFEEVETELGMRPRDRRRQVLDAYTADGLEYAFYRFGLLAFLERRGYNQFRFDLSAVSTGGERVCVHGRAGGAEHLLIDCVVERQARDGEEWLYVHWLALRDPRARFSDRRPRLPGQEVPGLGLAREVTELLVLMARRLQLAGLAFTPAWYHTAYVVRSRFRFADPARQGRFEALQRDLGVVPLVVVSKALAEGRVRMNDEPYTWEAVEMRYRLEASGEDREAVEAERDRVRFTLAGPDEAPAAGAEAAEAAGTPAPGDGA